MLNFKLETVVRRSKANSARSKAAAAAAAVAVAAAAAAVAVVAAAVAAAAAAVAARLDNRPSSHFLKSNSHLTIVRGHTTTDDERIAHATAAFTNNTHAAASVEHRTETNGVRRDETFIRAVTL